MAFSPPFRRFLVLVVLGGMGIALYATRPRLDAHLKGEEADLRTQGCLSNLKQIGQAYAQYALDYDGKLPRGVDPKDRFNPASAARWRAESDGKFDPAKTPLLHHILRPYVKSSTVFHCPADVGWTTNRLSQDDTDGGLRDVHPSSYARFGTSYYCWTGFSLGLNTAADIKNPAQEVLLFDGELWHGSKVNSSVNGLFADGHVQNLTFDQFMTASNGGD